MHRKIGSTIMSALLLGCPCASAFTPPLHFEKDTVGFANMTVFEYQNGIARVRRGESAKQKRYTRRCFVLCRTTMQFKKFARFDPHAPPLSDEDLAKRIRQVTHHAAWHDPLPEEQRVVFPVFAKKPKKPGNSTDTDRYVVYDPNHPDGPRELTWSQTVRSFAYQKDWDFVGGNVRVYQVYGMPLQ